MNSTFEKAKTKFKPDQTLQNHAFIFKSDMATMEKIREYLLKAGCALIYQTHSNDKIFIRKVADDEGI